MNLLITLSKRTALPLHYAFTQLACKCECLAYGLGK